MDQLDIYLPIAERSENVLILLATGGLVGFLSGVFGVGGGFLLTPFLIFLGIPAPVAVASGAAVGVGSAGCAPQAVKSRLAASTKIPIHLIFLFIV